MFLVNGTIGLYDIQYTGQVSIAEETYNPIKQNEPTY